MPMPVSPWPLEQIQGFVLRGYRQSFVRYFALSVVNLQAAQTFLTGLAARTGDGPKITSADPWLTKPDTCLNIGFTWRGLKTFKLPADSLASFSDNMFSLPFTQGAVARAPAIGDIGQSDPAGWRIDDTRFDVMLALYALTDKALEDGCTALAAAFEAGFGPLDKVPTFDSQELEDGNVYFGYKDGIAQPIIAGSPFASEPDGDQAQADPGAFMLGTATPGSFYASVPAPRPARLGLYGTFAAFRLLVQDVDGYDAQIAALAPAFGQAFGITDPAVQIAGLKAKLCGRWPNGTPLAMFPIQGDKMPPALPPQRINDFNYNPTDPNAPPDKGQDCPFGAHIRRCNPRDSNNVAGDAVNHRILRRAMAYQLPYDANNRDTGERGLVGLFCGASLMLQFEFLMKTWINNPSGFGPVIDQADPVMGTNMTPPAPAPGQPTPSFRETMPTSATERRTSFTLNSFTHTKASAYLFFPGIEGVAWIAEQAG
jgi:deferrochelatase/peroxidase EfeB